MVAPPRCEFQPSHHPLPKRTSDPGLEVTCLETHNLAFTTWDYPDDVDCGNPFTRPQDPQEMCYQLNQQMSDDERMFPYKFTRRDGRRERRIAVPSLVYKYNHTMILLFCTPVQQLRCCRMFML